MCQITGMQFLKRTKIGYKPGQMGKIENPRKKNVLHVEHIIEIIVLLISVLILKNSETS